MGAGFAGSGQPSGLSRLATVGRGRLRKGSKRPAGIPSTSCRMGLSTP